MDLHADRKQKHPGYAQWHSNPQRNRHHFAAFLLVACGVTFGIITTIAQDMPIYAYTPPNVTPPPSVRSLTNEMLTAIQAYEATPAHVRAELLVLVEPIIERRNSALARLHAKDADRAALETLPPEFIAQLSPEIAAWFTSETFAPEGDEISLVAAAGASIESAVSAVTESGGEDGRECVRGTTTAVITPRSAVAYGPHDTLSYTLTITNADSGGCTPSVYTISTMLPSGWMGSISPSEITIDPASSDSIQLTATAPASAATGMYTLSARAAGDTADHSAEIAATQIIFPR